MRPTRRREPDLFEESKDRSGIPRERRQAMVQMLGTLLTEALAPEPPTRIGKEVRDEPHRG